jgi:hypothetical protein
VRHFPLALGQHVAPELLECRLHPVLEIITQALIVIALDFVTAQQATLAELADKFAHQRFDGAQQVQLIDPQAFTPETLEQAEEILVSLPVSTM